MSKPKKPKPKAKSRTYWKLEAALADADLSPGKCAAKAKLHRQSLYAILKQPRAERIEGHTLTQLCEALDCQPGDLLEYKGK